MNSIEKEAAYKGYGLACLFRCLVLQFMEDISDRELERYIQENKAAKWFCDFGLTERTPDHSVFSRIRKRIGTNQLSQIFNLVKDQLKDQGLMSEVFTFVDASHLIAKANSWEERDAVIKKKYDQLNNETLPKVAKDKQAKIGCKGGSKYWYGYKKHQSVDMQSGLINKVALSAANVTDNKGFKDLCPNDGAVYADKGYCLEDSQKAAKIKKCTFGSDKKE